MKIQINIQSYSDIITNSSTELFCVIDGATGIIKEIENYLNSIGLDVECQGSYKDYEDNTRASIQFDMERGDNEIPQSHFIALLKEVITKQFGNENYEILTDVYY